LMACTCKETMNAWGCPVHAPKHMEAAIKESRSPMHMYVWTDLVSFLAVAQASSVADARRAMLVEMGESGDGSCFERDRARNTVLNQTPSIWHGTNAAFALSESAESRENAALCEKYLQEVEQLRKRVQELEAAKPTSPLYDRILAALQTGPMVHNEEWIARQIAELVEAEKDQLTTRIEAVQEVLAPLALPNESEADVATGIAAKARLWDEVRPLLYNWRIGRMKEERLVRQWIHEHESDLEAL